MLVRLVLALLAVASPCTAGDGPGPEDTVRRYLTALHAGDFAAAYPLVTGATAEDKTREQWIAEQQWATQTCDVTILAFEVFPAPVAGDSASVPTLLRSRDAFAGDRVVEERELYTLVRDGGVWRISRQQIVEPGARTTWFPDHPTPAAPLP